MPSSFSPCVSAEPPEILAFDFGKPVMDEGDFVHVSCIVTKGDMPLRIRWSLHGALVGAETGIETSQGRGGGDGGKKKSFIGSE